MIKCHLSRIMGERKLKVSEVARDTGVSRSTITLLYLETAKHFDLDVMEVLCRYFGIGVGEMLECIDLDKGEYKGKGQE